VVPEIGLQASDLPEEDEFYREDGVREHVSLHREPVLDQVPGPLDAVATGERSGASISLYGSQPTEFSIAIVRKRLFEGHSQIDVLRERSEGALAVACDDPIACVATAPTPARTHGVTARIAKYFDWTAHPTSPVAGSAATIENVPA
jgi:hypothetical protein